MIVWSFSLTGPEPHATSTVWLVLSSSMAEYCILPTVLCLHSKDKRFSRWLSIHLKQLMYFMMIDGGCCGLCICIIWCTCIVPLNGRTSWLWIFFFFHIFKIISFYYMYFNFSQIVLKSFRESIKTIDIFAFMYKPVGCFFTVPPTPSGIPLPWPASK